MRYLGADPSRAADDIEVLVMFALNERIVAEYDRMTGGK